MPDKRSRSGFTLVELLVVILIIGILASLALPWLLQALCLGRQAGAVALLSQVGQSCVLYQQGLGVYPPGRGIGSRDLVQALQAKGPRRLPYFEFREDALHLGHLINPVWGLEGVPPSNWIHYRHNGGPRTGAAPPLEGGMPVHRKYSFDLWAAGCDFRPEHPPSHWSLRFE